MRVHTVTLAVALCAAAALPAAAAPSATTPSTAAPPAAARQRATGPVLVDCFWHQVIRPTDYLLACGDGNSRLTSLHWSGWGTESAVATGVNVVNDCKPYCAAGTFHSYAVVVRLDHPGTWKRQPQVQHYTRMTLDYPRGRPAGFPHEVTYPLWS